MATAGKAWQDEILEIIRGDSGPMSAYDVLAEMRVHNAKMAPTTVYRALAALTDQHLIHRLESKNAYFACQTEGHEHDAVLSICEDCGSVEESVVPELVSALASVVNKSGFAAKRHVIEVHGTCETCTTNPASP